MSTIQKDAEAAVAYTRRFFRKFLLKAYYAQIHLSTAHSTMWESRREQYNAIWQRKPSKITVVHAELLAGVKVLF